jgi:purine nucleosidase
MVRSSCMCHCYHTKVPIHRTFGLNVTTKLVLKNDEEVDFFSSDLMKAVADFGSPWLEKNDMTFHDPVAGACLFEPQLCEYQRGFIDVDFKNEQSLRMMSFKASNVGHCEIATTVNRNKFFEHYFSIVCR